MSGMRERFLDCVGTDRAPHAVLLTGPMGSGRTELARRAAARYCLGEDAPDRLTNCPNYLELNGASASVEQVRGLTASTAMQGFNGGKQAYLIVNAHRMNPQSQNALLKTLEEPPAGTLLLLTGSEPGMLPTIRSRCMTLRLGAGSMDAARQLLIKSGVPPDTAALCAALSDGVPGQAAAFSAPEYQAFRKEAIRLLEEALFRSAPFTEVQGLLTVTGGDDGEAQPEEAAGGKRKKKKADTGLTEQLLEIWESLLRDGLLLALERGGTGSSIGPLLRNSDASQLAEAIGSRFTPGQIQGIIEWIESAQMRLSGYANPLLTMDALLARLCIKETV